ncbi:MAG TPA: hypothetical protein VHR66_23580 [Gemmataceae bacterium]|jgi:hypothetical protein|nr:hypothetical protein [Gemmataceae bacterium]
MMVAAALAAGMTPANLATEPTWLNDYAAAQTRVQAIKKPMAVFVGSGKDGWAKIVKSGSIDPEINKLLANKFVCVYADTDTTAGRALATAFEVTNKGLVISDKAGTTQAYNLSGDLTREELSQTLVKYAALDKEVRATESVGRAAAVAPPVYYRQGYYTTGST